MDLQDLSNGSIEIADDFLDPLVPGAPPLAVPHNVYIRDTLPFDSQYEDGLLVYSISNPLQPQLIAHYDTHPENNQYNGYYGNWGNYPWLPSGNIVAGDMQNGLQILRITSASSGTKTPDILQAAIVPNPASEQISLRLPGSQGEWRYQVFSATGQTMRTENVASRREAAFSVAEWPAGVYLVAIQAGEQSVVQKVVVS